MSAVRRENPLTDAQKRRLLQLKAERELFLEDGDSESAEQFCCFATREGCLACACVAIALVIIFALLCILFLVLATGWRRSPRRPGVPPLGQPNPSPHPVRHFDDSAIVEPPFLLSIGPKWQDLKNSVMKHLFSQFYDRCSIECTTEEWESEFDRLAGFPIPPHYKLPRQKFLNGPKYPVLHKCTPKIDKKKKYPRAQAKQDEYVKDLFTGDCGGVFVDVGAGDGKTWSDSAWLDEVYGWRGLTIEGGSIGEVIPGNRPNSIYVPHFVASAKGRPKFVDVSSLSGDADTSAFNHIWDLSSPLLQSKVFRTLEEDPEAHCVITCPRVMSLQSILNQNHIRHIDFLSIDVKGSELSVLESIDWMKTTVSVIIVEQVPDFAENNDVNDLLVEKLGYRRLEILKNQDAVYGKIHKRF